MSAQDVYNQAASVRSLTGVDPAIIATIATTESNLSLKPFTLGITTVATRGGVGASRQSVGSKSRYAGGSQPAAFWAYSDGAEAAVAFKEYITHYQPALVGLLGDAHAFFNPSGPILQSNYYVPTPGGQSTTAYYSNWQKIAQGFTSAGSPSSTDKPLTPLVTSIPAQSGIGSIDRGGGVTDAKPKWVVDPATTTTTTLNPLAGVAAALGGGFSTLGTSIHDAANTAVLSMLHVLLALLFIAMILLGLYLLLAS